MEKVKRIGVGRDPNIKPTALVNNLLDHLDDIDQIYCVVVTKDGGFIEACSGNAGGVAFSIAVLQKYLLDLI